MNVTKHDCDEDKRQQEQLVGKLFCDEYKRVTGIELKGNKEGAQPPDRVFFYKNSQIGCEMFQVEQFYSSRAIFDELKDSIPKEVESRGLEQQFQEITICFPNLIQTNTAEEIKAKHRKLKIKGKKVAHCAKELVDLVCKHVSSVDSVSAKELVIDIDKKVYPALSVVTPKILLSKSPCTHIGRSNGEVTPLIIIGGNYQLPRDTELVCELMGVMEEKIERKKDPTSGWQSINHSVLIAHEIPKKQSYLGPMIEWRKYLEIAAEKVALLQWFDELWFVRPVTVITETDIIESKAQFICGNHLKP